MKKHGTGLAVRLMVLAMAVLLIVAALPLAGSFAMAAKTKGAYFTTGFPRFAYVITGLKVEDGDNTVKLYQNADMQPYDTYTGVYPIPAQVYDSEDMRLYTVTEIGGAVGDTVPGALQNVPVTGIILPETITAIGAKAFAGDTALAELTFPTSVTSAAADAFTGVTLQQLTLNVVTETTLSGTTAYTSARRMVSLPGQITDLQVSQPLTIAGPVTLSGGVQIDNSDILVQSGATLTLAGELKGDGVVEVKNGGSFVLGAASPSFTGRIRLTEAAARFVNNTNAPVSVVNAAGKAVTAAPGETVLGGEQEQPAVQPTQAPDDNTGETDTNPRITHNDGGTVTVEDAGKTVVIVASQGYYVEEVVINGLSMGNITRYEFEAASTQNTVAVTFAEGQESEGPGTDIPTTGFIDVPASASYAGSVTLLAEVGIFHGVGGNRFAPNGITNRGMTATLLKRMESYAPTFRIVPKEEETLPADVSEGQWYAEAAAWANATGILPCDADGNFNAPRASTRQELALCLYRFTQLRGYSTKVDASLYRRYQDATLLEGEIRQAMVWAASKGYLSAENRVLDPSGTMTRAAVADMLARYLRVYG